MSKEKRLRTKVVCICSSNDDFISCIIRIRGFKKPTARFSSGEWTNDCVTNGAEVLNSVG